MADCLDEERSRAFCLAIRQVHELSLDLIKVSEVEELGDPRLRYVELQQLNRNCGHSVYIAHFTASMKRLTWRDIRSRWRKNGSSTCKVGTSRTPILY